MSKKFEQLLEYVVNNETEKAQALFHDIVVGKSREIYENLIAAEAYDEETDESIGGDQVEGLLDEISADESTIGEEDETMMGGEEHPEGDMGGEEHPDMDGANSHHDSEDLESRLLDIESAMEQLKADLADKVTDVAHDEESDDEESDDEEMDDEESDDEESDDEESDDEESDDEELYEEEEEDEEEEDLNEDVILEYTENVGKPYGGGKVAGTTEQSGVNKTSPVNTKKRSHSIEGSPVQIKDGGQGNHGVKAPGKLTSATTKPDMKRVPGADPKKV